MENTGTDTDTGLPLGRSFWAIQPDALPRILAAHRGRGLLQELQAKVAIAAPARAARRRTTTSGGGYVAVIPLTGLLTPRGSFFSMLFGGGGGLVDFREAFREALNSPEIQAIVLDVDSPGGYVDLVPETAQEVYDSRGTKPIVAVVNTKAYSAAYWIAAQADEVVLTPSGAAGSIGCYMLHEDWSKWNEDMGIDPTYVFAGRYKIDGNPDEPLSESAREDWQREVDDLAAMFVDAVAAGRGITAAEVEAGYGQGRTFRGARALEAGLVDRIDTLDTVVHELLAPAAGGASAARVERVPISLQAAADDDQPEPDDDSEETQPDEPEPETDEGAAEDDVDTADDAEAAAPAEATAAERAAWLDVQVA
jgi:signal peptide peptidase SppA